MANVAITRKIMMYICGKCDVRFELENELNTHISTHGNNMNYQCILCDKAFISGSKLKYHVEITHARARSFKCNICLATFKSDNNLRSRKVCHSSEKNMHVPYVKSSFYANLSC